MSTQPNPPVKIKVRFASDTYVARIKPTSRLSLMQAVQCSCTSGPTFAARRAAAKALRCEERDIHLTTEVECHWMCPGIYLATRK